MRVSVIGTGYLGAVHAAGMAELGFDVVGVDVDTSRIAMLREGRAPFYEPDLEPLLRKHVGNRGRLAFTDDLAAVRDADVHFLCIGTPQRAGATAADLSFLEAAVEALGKELSGRSTLVVGKSTVPVGTADVLQARLTELAGPGVELAWNPEFLREGYAVEDTLHPDRLVLGVRSQQAEDTLRRVYAEAIESGTPVIVTGYTTAELVKTSANAFLATKISFINAVSELCAVAGADVTTLADAIGLDARIGRRFLNAGLGFGGGCLPKDVRAFRSRAEELGVGDSFRFLDEVDRINLSRRDKVVGLVRALVGDEVRGRRVGVLGASFKPHSDDVRDSPSLDVAAQLARAGAVVHVYDPVARDAVRRSAPELGIAGSAFEACREADVVLHLTEWPEFRAVDPAALAQVVGTPTVIDGRNCLDRARWRDAGWTYLGLGVA